MAGLAAGVFTGWWVRGRGHEPTSQVADSPVIVPSLLPSTSSNASATAGEPLELISLTGDLVTIPEELQLAVVYGRVHGLDAIVVEQLLE